MRILAGSMEPVENGFLHAGYISADARPLEEWSFRGRFFNTSSVANKDKSLPVEYHGLCGYVDTVEALQLADKRPAPDAVIGAPRAGSLDGGQSLFNFVVAACFFASLAAWYLMRDKAARLERGRARMFFVLSMCVLCAIIAVFNHPIWMQLGFVPDPLIVAQDARAPWEGIAPQRYKNPDLATRVIMEGIIADALSSTPFPVASLTQIQRQVGLPTKDPTPGQAYALKTYGWDGWGHPIRLKATAGPKQPGPVDDAICHYTLSSAGADGAFDTADDVIVNCAAPSEHKWDSEKRALFARKTGGEWKLLYHRWGGRLFAYGNRKGAQELTGTNLYDIVPMRNGGEIVPDLIAGCDQAKVDKTHDPLVLVILPEYKRN